MKHLKQSLNESLSVRTINEARFISDEIGKMVNTEDLEMACNKMSYWADKFELVTPTKIKKLFPDADKDKLEDYCTIISHMGEQISGIVQICRDEVLGRDEDPEEALAYLDDAFNIKGRVENATENIISDYAINSATNDEGIYNMVQDVADRWNEISKIMIGQDWYNPRNYK